MSEPTPTPVEPKESGLQDTGIGGLWTIAPEYGKRLFASFTASTAPKNRAEHHTNYNILGTQSDFYSVVNGVALIEIVGYLTKNDWWWSDTSLSFVLQQLEHARQDSSVTAILLLIDSPGGGAPGTMEVMHTIREVNESKPVYAYIQDLGASGAYMIASQARKIFANQLAIIGSLGVISVIADFSEMYSEAGIKIYAITTGSRKADGHPGIPVTDGALGAYQRLVDDTYAPLKTAVQLGRGMDEKEIDAVSDAALYVGVQALSVKLVDVIVERIDDVYVQIDKETQTMSEALKVKFEAEHAPLIAQWKTEAKAEGYAEGAASEKKRFSELTKVFGDRLILLCESYGAGSTLEQARTVLLNCLLEENKELRKASVSSAPSKEAPDRGKKTVTVAAPDKDDEADVGTDPISVRAQRRTSRALREGSLEASIKAAWEADHDDCKKDFSSYEAYEAFCRSEEATTARQEN